MNTLTIENEFDHNDFTSCVDRGMFLINNRKKQIESEGYTFYTNINSCRWAIEQKIINRPYGTTMMSAVIDFVERIENKEKEANNI